MEEIGSLSDGNSMYDTIDIANITKKQFPTKKTLEIFHNFLKEKLPTFKTIPGESVIEKYFSPIRSDLETLGGPFLSELLTGISGEGIIVTPYNETFQFKFNLDNTVLSLDSIVQKKSLKDISESDLNFISEYIIEKILICLEIAYEETIATIDGIGEKLSIFWHPLPSGIIHKKDSLLPPFYLDGLIANLQFNFLRGQYSKELITLQSPDIDWIKKVRQVVLREEFHRYLATLLLLGQDPLSGDLFGSLILNYDIPNPRFSQPRAENWEGGYTGRRTPEECRYYLSQKWDEDEWSGFLPHEHSFTQFWIVILGEGQLAVYDRTGIEGYVNERAIGFRAGDLMSSGRSAHKLGSHVKLHPAFSAIRRIF